MRNLNGNVGMFHMKDSNIFSPCIFFGANIVLTVIYKLWVSLTINAAIQKISFPKTVMCSKCMFY